MKKYNIKEHIRKIIPQIPNKYFLRVIYHEGTNKKWLIAEQYIDDSVLNGLCYFGDNIIGGIKESYKLEKKYLERKYKITLLKNLIEGEKQNIPILYQDKIRKLTLQEYIALATEIKDLKLEVNKKKLKVIDKTIKRKKLK